MASIPLQCHFWHSEHDHGTSFGFPDYPRDFNKQWKEYHCSARAVMDDEPWNFVACPRDSNAGDFMCSACGRDEHVAHTDAIVISVDGACRGNGGFYAESGVGVFFHQDSNLNRTLRIDDNHHTSQRAELYAAREALRLAKQVQEENPVKGTPRIYLPPRGPRRKLRRVVIRTDSKYLVGAMTNWIFKWRDNGYLNARGQEVVNEDLFRALEEAVDELNDVKVDVQFWHVPREQNGEADCLANAALDGISEDDALDEYYR